MTRGAVERPVLRLDLADEQAWLGDAPLRLTPKAFAMLRHLVAHADRLVTKDELFRALWPGVAVSDSVLTTVVREIRKALGEGSRGPGYIQTVHRRGYRFVGPMHSAATPPPALPVVGRAGELTSLHETLTAARGGQRQLVFVTGEAGIGKTTLIERFLAEADALPEASVVHGQCVERYGRAEAYLPWLDALGQLCRRPGGERTVAVLRRVAPMWLAQMPAQLDAAERAALQGELAGAPPERMLREMCEALEALAAERPLVIALEDLHWIDQSSLELLAAVARRREPARLMLLATYRPVELQASGHPLQGLKQELQAHGQCIELPVAFLPRDAVADYLAARFPGLPNAVAPVVHRRSDGNPLFMVNIAEYLAGRALIVEADGAWLLRGDAATLDAVVPESLRGMIDRQLDRLEPEERRLVEAASVAGAEFADAALAPALDSGVEAVGARCAALARRGLFLRPAGDEDWADGTAVRRYAFIHALYAEVLYDALPPSRRQRLHRAVAERLEAGYGKQVGQIAAALAQHFERAREPGRAVAYLAQAAQNAVQRLAHNEAIVALNRALTLLPLLPDGPERKRRELALRMALAPALMQTKGYATPEVDDVYAGAEALCREVGEDWQFFSVLIGRTGSALLGGRTAQAKAIAVQSLEIARRRQSQRYLTQAESAVGIISVWRGEFASAAEHLEASRVAYEAVDQPPPAFRLLHDPGAAGRSYAGWAMWMLGRPEAARRESDAAVALARGLAHPFSLAFALVFATFVDQARRDVAATRERAEATLALCAEHGFAMYHAVATIFRGWAIAEAGERRAGLAVMEAGRTAYNATGAVLVRPYYGALIAAAQMREGMREEARANIATALAEVARTGERVYEAELHRLRGELEGDETALRQALDIAREQQALSLELRAATSLARLTRTDEVRSLLRDTRSRFTEGFETPDLREAALLLGDRVAMAGELR